MNQLTVMNWKSEIKTYNVRTNLYRHIRVVRHLVYCPIGARSEIISCEVVAYRKLKTIENFKAPALKVIVVAHEKCSHREVRKYDMMVFFYTVVNYYFELSFDLKPISYIMTSCIRSHT